MTHQLPNQPTPDTRIIGEELAITKPWCQRGARLLVQQRVSLSGPTEIEVLEWSVDGRFVRVRYPNSGGHRLVEGGPMQPPHETWTDIQKEQWIVAGVLWPTRPEHRELMQMHIDRLGMHRP